MNVKELIEKLKEFDGEAQVSIVFDGADRMNVQKVWLAKSGSILLCDDNHTIYDDNDRPIGAPLQGKEPYWGTDNIPD